MQKLESRTVGLKPSKNGHVGGVAFPVANVVFCSGLYSLSLILWSGLQHCCCIKLRYYDKTGSTV